MHKRALFQNFRSMLYKFYLSALSIVSIKAIFCDNRRLLYGPLATCRTYAPSCTLTSAGITTVRDASCSKQQNITDIN